MRSQRAFTLIELMVAVVIITVGSVFVLGAFSRSMSVLATAERTIQANELLMAQIGVLDRDGRLTQPVIPLEASGTFAEPGQGFSWHRSTRDINIDFDDTPNHSLGELYAEETVSVSWMQARVPQSISVTRFVQKRVEAT